MKAGFDSLSRGKLDTFITCRRQFQLRYKDHLPWPFVPMDEKKQAALALGKRFHQLLHRHFLGLPVEAEAASDARLSRWWRIFQEQKPAPIGARPETAQLLPEFSLTVPLGSYLLTGRFDLLLLEKDRLRIFDWKTEAQPPTQRDRREALQTRLYLTLAAESGRALSAFNNRTVDPTKSPAQNSLENHLFPPEHITLTYWYVNDPAAEVTFNYDQAQHEKNWSYLLALAQELEKQERIEGIWPLTDDLSACARCLYQIICDRQSEHQDLLTWEPELKETSIEPDRP